jgi:hypothetical protein
MQTLVWCDSRRDVEERRQRLGFLQRQPTRVGFAHAPALYRELHERSGNRRGAIESDRRSLALNPGNANAAARIRVLEQAR